MRHRGGAFFLTPLHRGVGTIAGKEKGCGWETSREGMANVILRNLLAACGGIMSKLQL